MRTWKFARPLGYSRVKSVAVTDAGSRQTGSRGRGQNRSRLRDHGCHRKSDFVPLSSSESRLLHEFDSSGRVGESATPGDSEAIPYKVPDGAECVTWEQEWRTSPFSVRVFSRRFVPFQGTGHNSARSCCRSRKEKSSSTLFPALWRSEEHTSELQSHSFISYAVFCL